MDEPLTYQQGQAILLTDPGVRTLSGRSRWIVQARSCLCPLRTFHRPCT